MSIFGILEMVFQHYNINSAVNIAPKVKCYISKSKFAFSECNGGYLNAIVFWPLGPFTIRILFVFHFVLSRNTACYWLESLAGGLLVFCPFGSTHASVSILFYNGTNE